MNLNSRDGILARLQRGQQVRARFVESNLVKGIAAQIRATRDALGWSQEKLGAEAGMNQNAIYRLESSAYGKMSLTTLRRIAAAMDVALVVRFVPFSELVDWVSGTPRLERGLRNEALNVPSFNDEFGAKPQAPSSSTVVDLTPLNDIPIRMAKIDAVRIGTERTTYAAPVNNEPSTIEMEMTAYGGH